MLSVNNKALQVLFIIAIALGFRLPGLSERPMHGDEAVNAVKFSQMMESGKFVYDPTEYHGPALSYITSPVAWISGNTSLKKLTETTLRLVPVIFGIGIILILFILGTGVEWYILILAALFSAISPAFVYYSRYYIHEMLFVFFCYLVLFSAYRYSINQKVLWISLMALSLGLMISTKETWIIITCTMAFSLCLTFLPFKRRRIMLIRFFNSMPLMHIIGFLTVVLLTILLFYTSFFQNFHGLIDGFSAFSTYFQRAANNAYHIHSWYMYFKWLLYFGGENGHLWSEGIIALFALCGIVAILSKNNFSSGENTFFYFIVIFVLATSFIFSMIPYKTPWNLLTFWFGFIFIGSIGFYYLFQKLKSRIYKAIFLLISFIFILQLGWQSFQLNFNHSYSIGNPYVYAHPVADVILISKRLEDIAKRIPEGHNIYIQVIAPDNDYWPLPWYLRSFDRVGWWDRVDSVTAAAPVIIAQAILEDEIVHKLYQLPPPGKRNLYLPLFDTYTELRPGIEIRGYILKDLSDNLNTITEQPVGFENK